MKEVSYKDLKFNPFNLLGKEWMLLSAGNEQDGCNTMTISWGHIGCMWGHNDPTVVAYIRASRYTKTFVDKEDYFTLCVMDASFKKQMAYLGSVSGRDENKIEKAGLTLNPARSRLSLALISVLVQLLVKPSLKSVVSELFHGSSHGLKVELCSQAGMVLGRVSRNSLMKTQKIT